MKPYLLFTKCSPDDHKAVNVADFEECFASLQDLRGYYEWFCTGCDARVVRYDGRSFKIITRLPAA